MIDWFRKGLWINTKDCIARAVLEEIEIDSIDYAVLAFFFQRVKQVISRGRECFYRLTVNGRSCDPQRPNFIQT